MKKNLVPATEKDIIIEEGEMGGGEKMPHPSQVRLGSRGVVKALFPPPRREAEGGRDRGRDGGRDEENKILNDRSRTRLTFLRRAIRG